jgi:hypothetical protein
MSRPLCRVSDAGCVRDGAAYSAAGVRIVTRSRGVDPDAVGTNQLIDLVDPAAARRARNAQFVCAKKLISRTASIRSGRSSPLAEIFVFRFPEINDCLRSSRLTRGAYASSRTSGAGCDGRVGVPGRGAPMRTAKSCGPDLPTLGSSRWIGDVGLWPDTP